MTEFIQGVRMSSDDGSTERPYIGTRHDYYLYNQAMVERWEKLHKHTTFSNEAEEMKCFHSFVSGYKYGLTVVLGPLLVESEYTLHSSESKLPQSPPQHPTTEPD